MATLYVAEYVRLALHAGTLGQVPDEPPIAEQHLAIGGSSVQSAAFNSSTRFVRVHTDATCSILIGANPTAATTNQRFTTNQTEFKGVPVGQNYKIAVISNS